MTTINLKKKKTDLQQNGNSTYISFAFYIRDGLLTWFFSPSSFSLLFFSSFLLAFLWWNKFIWYCCFCTNEIKTITLDTTENKPSSWNVPYAEKLDKKKCAASQRKFLPFLCMPLCTHTHTRVSVGNHQIRYRYTIQECMQSLSILGDSLVFVHCQWLNWSFKLYELNFIVVHIEQNRRKKIKKTLTHALWYAMT